MNKSPNMDKFTKLDQIAMVITSNLICLDLPRGKIKEITQQMMDDLMDLFETLGIDINDRTP